MVYGRILYNTIREYTPRSFPTIPFSQTAKPRFGKPNITQEDSLKSSASGTLTPWSREDGDCSETSSTTAGPIKFSCLASVLLYGHRSTSPASGSTKLITNKEDSKQQSPRSEPTRRSSDKLRRLKKRLRELLKKLRLLQVVHLRTSSDYQHKSLYDYHLNLWNKINVEGSEGPSQSQGVLVVRGRDKSPGNHELTAAALQQEADRRHHQDQRNETCAGNSSQKAIGPWFPSIALKRTKAHIRADARRKDSRHIEETSRNTHWHSLVDQEDGGGDSYIWREDNSAERVGEEGR